MLPVPIVTLGRVWMTPGRWAQHAAVPEVFPGLQLRAQNEKEQSRTPAAHHAHTSLFHPSATLHSAALVLTAMLQKRGKENNLSR